MPAGRLNSGAHSPELPKAKHPKGKHMDRCHPTSNKTVWREDGAGENCQIYQAGKNKNLNFECIYMYVKSFLVNAKKKKKTIIAVYLHVIPQ